MASPALNADDGAVADLAATMHAVRIPPLPYNLGPRVEHIQVAADAHLSDVIASALALPDWFVAELIRFGAVHYCPVMPAAAAAAAPRMSAAHLARLDVARAAGIARHGRSPALQHPRRILADTNVSAGGYVRVHVHPKRFPAAHSVNWAARVLTITPEYVVVDKPPGVQVPPTVDNVLESVVACVGAALSLPPGSLLNTHRLDVGTSGVVLLARSPAFASWFSGLLRADRSAGLLKLYRCLTAHPPPLGRLVHVASLHERSGGEPAHTRMRRPRSSSSGGASCETATAAATEDGAHCELIVQQASRCAVHCAWA
jgi:23S rRNA-/tRNA-specific pseudouridylate synthase